MGDFSEGLAPVQPFNKRWPGNLAYINPKGEIVLQFKSTNPNSPTRVDWDLHAYRFFGGVALVSAGNEADEDAQVYLDQQGKIISPVVMRPQQVVQTPPAPPPMLAAKVHEPQSGSPPAPPETVPPTAPPVAPPSAPPDNDIEGHSVWPWTSTRLVAQEDVQSLSLAELMLMRNEIFARHGWVFTQDDLRQVFEAQPWYRPKGTLANRAEANRQAAAELSSVEKKNVQTILQYEKSLKSER